MESDAATSRFLRLAPLVQLAALVSLGSQPTSEGFGQVTTASPEETFNPRTALTGVRTKNRTLMFRAHRSALATSVTAANAAVAQAALVVFLEKK
ncbi:hypothetical protein ACOTTU_24500 [Roseobacter sp. EG26]|uniref:hypothetical protein n=1 Tax=Roseobacter sp. EG26 TaxID=3412477 RepID=UPI003CE4A3A2